MSPKFCPDCRQVFPNEDGDQCPSCAARREPECHDEELIFQEALARQGDARDAFLLERCAGDSKLRKRIENLIRATDFTDGLLDDIPNESLADTEDALPEQTGKTIDNYKLLQKIGEGGFGVVYMADQVRPVKRKVALKVIKPGMDSKAVVARFEAERQALAMMDHPHIAKVFDGGVSDEGRPYFVMELVHGVSLTKYCDKKKLPTSARLLLFIDVCYAVQHAHQKGIIHRDLKPTNVLVTLHDGKPVVKVIDFGVAKALNQQQLTEKTLFTRFGQMIGTPQYMSPEQAEMSGLDVDTRSDVYSLGVLLYELLTGSTPLSLDEIKDAGYAEIQRIISEQVSSKPSTRLSTTTEQDLIEISDHRGVSPNELRNQLNGDLDWIVMKSLENERERRYNSPQDFATDLYRFIDNEPVEARPPSISYRMQEYVRRNRLFVATTATVASILIAATVLSGGFALLALKARHQAETEKRIAQKRTTEAERDRDAKTDAVEAEIKAKERLQQQIYNLKMAQAFTAHSDWDFDRVAKLLESTDSAQLCFEQRLLARQLRNHHPIIEDDCESIATCAVFSSDAKQLIIGTSSSKIFVFDLPTKSKSTFDLAKNGIDQWWSTTKICISKSTGNLFFSGESADGRGFVAFARTVDAAPVLIRDLSSTPDDMIIAGKRLLLASSDGKLYAWNERDLSHPEWETQITDPADRSPIYMAYHNGKLLTSFQSGREVVEWDVEKQAITGRLAVEFPIRNIDLSEDGKKLITAHIGGISFFDRVSDGWRFTHRITERSNLALISNDGSFVAAADAFGGIRIIDPVDSQTIGRFVHTQGVSTVKGISISVDDTLIATVDAFGSIKVWNRNTSSPPIIQGSVSPNAFHFIGISPGKKKLAVAVQNRSRVNIWDLEANRVEEVRGIDVDKAASSKRTPRKPGISGLDISSDARLLAVAANDRIIVWNLEDKSIVREIDAGFPPWAVSFSPTADLLAIAGLDGVAVFRFESNQIDRLTGLENGYSYLTVDFSFDGQYLACGGGRFHYYSDRREGEVLVWHLANTKKPIVKRPRDQIVYDVDFANSDFRLASGGLDAQVEITDILSEQTKELENSRSWWITGLTFTPDDSRVITVDGRGLTFWNSVTGDEIGSLATNDQIRRVGFLSDGNTMITSSVEGFVRAWYADPKSTE